MRSCESLGRYEEAMQDFAAAAAVFREAHDATGAALASCNAALAAAQLGRDGEAVIKNIEIDDT